MCEKCQGWFGGCACDATGGKAVISEVYNFEYNNEEYPGCEKVLQAIKDADILFFAHCSYPGLISYRIVFTSEEAKRSFDKVLLTLKKD